MEISTLSSFNGIFASLRHHPRLRLRVAGIFIALGGLALDLVCLTLIAFHFNDWNIDRPRSYPVQLGAIFVYVISTSYQLLDLVIPSLPNEVKEAFKPHGEAGGAEEKRAMAIKIFIFDIFCFLLFLNLLITNVILLSGVGKRKQIDVYVSVPWMICGVIHCYIAVQTVLSPLKKPKGIQLGDLSAQYAAIDLQDDEGGDEETGQLLRKDDVGSLDRNLIH